MQKKKTARGGAKTAASKKPPLKKAEGQEKFSLKRLIFGEEKTDLSELEAGSTTILDILSPTAIDTKSRDYILVDGVYHAYLYVAGYGYSPPWAPAGWPRWLRPERASASASRSSARARIRSCPKSPRPPW